MAIRSIKSTILDRKYLSLRSIEAALINVDFSKMVVNKPWGYEYLLANTPLVEIWHLSLDFHKSTSMHCHPNKKTALVVLDGKARFSSLSRSIELKPLDAITIGPGVFHSTQCISKGGLKMLEIETPPMKHDLIRLEDRYGRANTGYEGIDQMRVANASYARFDNNEPCLINNFCNNNILISFVEEVSDLRDGLLKNIDTAILINGFIKSRRGEIKYSIGDVIPIKDIRNDKYAFKNISLLSIQKNER